MLQFNLDKVVKLVSEMRKATNHLKLLKMIDKGLFLNDDDKIASAKYNFIVSIESAIDICNHIISQNGYRVPDDYAETFQVLGDVGAFDKDFVKGLKAMAKFRNRLVHLYWEVDDEQVYEILQSKLDDFNIFLNSIAIFLELQHL
ncbi:MAG: type VII toxin-antitoxin system HepT family RNase toxin [Bacillota bacterium]